MTYKYFDCKTTQVDTKRKTYTDKSGGKNQLRIQATNVITKDCAVTKAIDEDRSHAEHDDEDKTLGTEITCERLRAIFREELLSWATGLAKAVAATDRA